MTKYSPQMAATVCKRIAMGESLRSVCGDKEMPSMYTIFQWVRKHPEFLLQYSLARDIQNDSTYEDILKLEEMVEREQINYSAANISIKSKQWRLERCAPQKFSVSQIVKLSGDASGEPIRINAAADMAVSIEAVRRVIAEEEKKLIGEPE